MTADRAPAPAAVAVEFRPVLGGDDRGRIIEAYVAGVMVGAGATVAECEALPAVRAARSLSED